MICSRWTKMCSMSVVEPLCSRGTTGRAYYFVMCSQRTCWTASCYTFFPIMLTLNKIISQHNMMCNIECGHVIICLHCAHSFLSSTWLALSLFQPCSVWNIFQMGITWFRVCSILASPFFKKLGPVTKCEHFIGIICSIHTGQLLHVGI